MNTNIPKHIAIIMDGNGRWAKKRGLPRSAGHKQGAENIRKIAIACNNLKVDALSVYAFSTENWKRPADEVNYLSKLLPKMFFNRYLAELKKNNIQVLALGEIEEFPKETREIIESAIEQTKENTGLKLTLAINYGSQREILLAAKQFARDVMNDPSTLDIDESGFERYLMSNKLPNVDLMIRTSGEERISNFMLWQLAYSELIFTPVLWPDFNETELNACIEEYGRRNRRFGGL